MKVLVFGDSLTFGPYGTYLEQAVAADGHTVTRCAVGGFAASSYLGNSGLPDNKAYTEAKYRAIKDQPYDIVIMSMGTNDATNLQAYNGEPDVFSLSQQVKNMIALANSFTNAKAIYWIGPPSFHPVAGGEKMNKALKTDRYTKTVPGQNVVGDLTYRANRLVTELGPKFSSSLSGKQGFFIDPREITKPYAPEGDIHLYGQGAATWATFTFQAVFKKACPIKKFTYSGQPLNFNPKTPVPIGAGSPVATGTGPSPAGGGFGNLVTAPPLPPPDINIKEYENFERAVHTDREDTSVPIMDDLSTVNGLIKHLAEKEYAEDHLSGLDSMHGIVFRIPEDFQGPHFDYSVEKAVQTLETSARKRYYKVRVAELSSTHGEIPKTFDNTPRDKFLIDQYKDFSAPEDLILRLGDKVKVTFENLKDHTGGRIIKRIPQSLQDKLVIPTIGGGGAPMCAATDGKTSFENIAGAGMISIPGLTVPLQSFGAGPAGSFSTNNRWVESNYNTLKSRCVKFDDTIRAASKAYGVPPNVIRAFIGIESGFNERAQSPGVGAQGMMQIMPSTEQFYKTQKGFLAGFKSGFSNTSFDIWNAHHNIFMGAYILKDLLSRFGNDIQKAAAGYNGGPGRVRAVDGWWKLIPNESKDYVIRMPLALNAFRKTYPSEG